MRAMGI